MKFFEFLKGRSKSKPHDILRRLAAEIKSLSEEGNSQSLSIPDDECNELENYLATTCAGCTANVYVRKQPKPEEIERCLIAAESTDIMLHIGNKVACLRPETRRIVCAIWGYLLKMEHPKSFQRPMVEYLINHLTLIDALLQQYGTCTNGAGVIVGVMIRDATRFQRVIEYIFKYDLVFKLLPVLRSPNFDVSADAFQTMKEIMTNHKEVSSVWLNRNFERFFAEYMMPMKNQADYVTIRQSLSVLSVLLLDRQFMDTMIQFVSKEEYLKTVLILLGNESRIIGYEAFNLFKIFAVNPQKPPNIVKLLNLNHSRIVKILNHIEQDRSDDVEFRQDKNAVVMKLDALKPQ
jgi:calcium binding protein 39